MANKLRNIILFLFFAQSVNAQISFFKTYGENGFDFGHGIVQLSDSSYVITGTSSSFQEGPSRAFMLKVDSMGQYIWSRSFGGDNSDLGRRIFHRETEGFWIAGFSNSFSTNSNFDFYLVKTDETGEPEWEKTYGTQDWERLWDAALLSDNGLILVGETVGLTSLDEDIYLVRTDAIGDTIWTKRLQSNLKDVAYSCVLLNDTTFVIAGCHGFGTESKGFVSAFHINGSQLWETELNSNNGSFVSQLQIYNNQIFGVGSTVTVAGENRPWAVKLNANGDLIDEIVESSLYEHYNNLAIRDDDSFFVSDYAELSENEVELLMLQWHTFFYFSNGFTAQLPLFGKHICNQMLVSNDGGIIYLGELSDPNSSNGGSHVSFIKLGPNEELVGSPDEILPLVNLSEYTISSNEVYPFPNPFVDIIEFNSYDIDLKYRLLDVNGKEIANGIVNSEIRTFDLQKGLYFLEIIGKDSHEIFKLIKN